MTREKLMNTCIRLARPEDTPAIQAIYAPVVISTPTSFELTPPAVEEMHQRIEEKLPMSAWACGPSASITR